jgi:GH18 family chitinase
MKKISSILYLLFFLISFTFLDAQQSKWYVSYYPYWCSGYYGTSDLAIAPWEIDWSGYHITHVVHFMDGNVCQNPPYSTLAFAHDSADLERCAFKNPGISSINWQDSLIKICHRKKVKVILVIQAVDPTNINYVAVDSVRTDVFANWLVGYCRRKGYDGLDLDWEGGMASANDVNRMVRRLRVALNTMTPHGLLFVCPAGDAGAVYSPSQDTCVDRFNYQAYTYAYAWHSGLQRNASWYVSPLHSGTTPAGFEPLSWDNRGFKDWVRTGHDISRWNFGLPTFGYTYYNLASDTLYQAYSGIAYTTYQTALNFLSNGGRKGWDDERKVPYIHGTTMRQVNISIGGWWTIPAGSTYWVTYENASSVQEKIKYMQDNCPNIGGFMSYDLSTDLVPGEKFGKRNPVTKAIGDALFGK